MEPTTPLIGGLMSDGEQIHFRSNDQDWLVSWHPPGAPPVGTPHGSAGVAGVPWPGDPAGECSGGFFIGLRQLGGN